MFVWVDGLGSGGVILVPLCCNFWVCCWMAVYYSWAVASAGQTYFSVIQMLSFLTAVGLLGCCHAWPAASALVRCCCMLLLSPSRQLLMSAAAPIAASAGVGLVTACWDCLLPLPSVLLMLVLPCKFPAAISFRLIGLIVFY